MLYQNKRLDKLQTGVYDKTTKDIIVLVIEKLPVSFCKSPLRCALKGFFVLYAKINRAY